MKLHFKDASLLTYPTLVPAGSINLVFGTQYTLVLDFVAGANEDAVNIASMGIVKWDLVIVPSYGDNTELWAASYAASVATTNRLQLPIQIQTSTAYSYVYGKESVSALLTLKGYTNAQVSTSIKLNIQLPMTLQGDASATPETEALAAKQAAAEAKAASTTAQASATSAAASAASAVSAAGKLPEPTEGEPGMVIAVDSDGTGYELKPRGQQTSWGNITGTITDQADLVASLSTKQNAITSTSKLDYALIDNTPSIPTVNNTTITFTQGGTQKGSFTLNQAAAATIALDGGSGTGGEVNVIETVKVDGVPLTVTGKAVDITGKQNLITSTSKLDYSLIANTPTIPTVHDSTVMFTQGGVLKGTITLNQASDSIVALDAGGEGGQTNVIEIVKVDGVALSVDSNKAVNITGKQNTITSDNKLDYSLIANTPTIPTVGNGKVTLTQAGSTKGEFTLNQADDITIALEGGGSGEANIIEVVQVDGTPLAVANKTVNITGKQNTITSDNKLDYSLIANTPTIPTVGNGRVTLTQAGSTKGTFTLNQADNITIALEGGGSGEANVIEIVKVDGVPLTVTGKAVDITGKQNTITSDNKLDYSLIANTPTIPTKVSDLTNDSGYQTSANVASAVASHNEYSAAHSTLFSAKANTADLTAHTENTDIHVAATDKSSWNAGLQTLSDHTGNTAIHVTASDKSNWNAGLDSLSDHTGNTTIHVTATDKSNWDAKAASATTLAGYGIADAYTKSEVDSKVSSVYRYKGSKATYSELPTTGQAVGDVWNIEQADPSHGIKAGDNVAWTGTAWDVLAGTVDLSNYVQKETGKGLSTNDYTTAEQTKLAGIEPGAEANVIEAITVNGGTEAPIVDKTAQLTIAIPTPNNPTITFQQGAATKGSITLNQATAATITLDASGEDNIIEAVQVDGTPLSITNKTVNITGKQDTIDAEHKLPYAYLDGAPTIPTVNDPTITFKQGTTTVGSVSLNQATADTITFAAPGDANVIEAVQVDGTPLAVTDKTVNITGKQNTITTTGVLAGVGSGATRAATAADGVYIEHTNSYAYHWNTGSHGDAYTSSLPTPSSDAAAYEDAACSEPAFYFEYVRYSNGYYVCVKDDEEISGDQATRDTSGDVSPHTSIGLTSSVHQSLTLASTAVQPAALENYVQKETGKGLSTNDYTTAEQTKLAGVESNADVNVIEVVKVDGTALSIVDKAVDITGKANSSDLTAHTSDSTIHVTASERTAWSGKQATIDRTTCLELRGIRYAAQVIPAATTEQSLTEYQPGRVWQHTPSAATMYKLTTYGTETADLCEVLLYVDMTNTASLTFVDMTRSSTTVVSPKTSLTPAVGDKWLYICRREFSVWNVYGIRVEEAE